MSFLYCILLFIGLLFALSILAVHRRWPMADTKPRGRTRILHPFRRLAFLFGLVWISMSDRLHGRSLAINAVLTPFETHRGTETMGADTTVLFFNALVKIGSSDRNFTPTAAQADVPYGILQNDLVDTGEPGVIRKGIAILGLYPESLPGVAAGAIAAGSLLVADIVTPGYVKQLPTAAGGGTFYVIGRSRFAVVNAGDPVSIIHCVPYAVTF